MRPFLFSSLLALAVLFAAPWALAQGMGHCLTEPLLVLAPPTVSQPLGVAKTPAKDLSWAASLRVEQGYAAVPHMPRLAVMCIDPQQPGCQIDRSDVPERQGSWHLSWDVPWATLPFEDLPPALEGKPLDGVPYVGGPREAFTRRWLRPPMG